MIFLHTNRDDCYYDCKIPKISKFVVWNLAVRKFSFEVPVFAIVNRIIKPISALETSKYHVAFTNSFSSYELNMSFN